MSRKNATKSQFRSVKRPVDKKLIVVNKSPQSTTQLATVLITATFPCTISGLRWSLTFNNIIATSDTNVRWAIVRVRDGVTVSTTAVSDAGDFYTPEQEVMAFGITHLGDSDGTVGPMIVNMEGNTKTMRKLMGGDTLQFIATAGAVNSVDILGIVQFFCKT